MKEKSTTRKAEGLGDRQTAEMLNTENQNGPVPQLEDEQLVLDTIMQALRGLKIGGRPRVAKIAREWERIFNYRIQVTVQERQRRAKARMVRMQVTAALKENATTSSPSGVHIRLNVSPGQD